MCDLNKRLELSTFFFVVKVSRGNSDHFSVNAQCSRCSTTGRFCL